MNNIVVIGDVMLDRYVHCDASRISPEAPIPVLRPLNETEVLGGAANVAVNLSRLDNNVTLIGQVFDDDAGKKIKKQLKKENIKFYNISGVEKSTLKIRYLVGNHQVVRLDIEDVRTTTLSTSKKKSIMRIFEGSNLIVVSDYNKGVITQELMTLVRESGVKFIVDPKKDNWSLYSGATVICPNFKELEAGVGERVLNLEVSAEQLKSKFNISNILVTLSADGLFLSDEKGRTEKIDAFNHEVVDVTGAGDIVISVLADGILRSQDLFETARLANQAAGSSVQTLGTYSFPNRGALDKFLNKIVFTNGCFDLLHVGHIDYLKKARSMGSSLIVGLNSDSSIRKLKGSSRPINDVLKRKMMLEALDCVDEVIVFDEETPENLIKKVKPHVLVKGADWQNLEIAGGNEVLKNGGRIEFIPFVYDTSTTELINRIKKET